MHAYLFRLVKRGLILSINFPILLKLQCLGLCLTINDTQYLLADLNFMENKKPEILTEDLIFSEPQERGSTGMTAQA